jgi:hypothetical protein
MKSKIITKKYAFKLISSGKATKLLDEIRSGIEVELDLLQDTPTATYNYILRLYYKENNN